MYIESLRSNHSLLKLGLNDFLKQCNSTITVIAFIIIPGETNNFNVETLRRQAITRQLKETIYEIGKKIERRIFESTLSGLIPTSDIISNDDIVKLKRHVLNLPTESLPPIVTHNVMDSHADSILLALRQAELFNRKEDRVKVIYHPEFLSANNPILSMDYEDFVRGCHLGVFPSYYEPWGYTPAECTVLGVPSVSTNVSGFGCYMEEMLERPAEHGIYVVDRRNKSVEESVQQLTEFLSGFCQKSRRQRMFLRNRTERLSPFLDWNNLVIDYCKAKKLAMSRTFNYPMETEKSTLSKQKIRTSTPLC